MALLTLGRLDLAGQSSPQRQALLLLAYLTVEGRKERTFLAGLFWPDAKQPLNNLSSALTRLRAVDSSYLTADRHTVAATAPADVSRFVSHAAAGRHVEALDLYQGRFLDGFDIDRVGYELQEWILAQRSSLAATARDCARRLAEDAFRAGRSGRATELAEQAFGLAEESVPDPETLIGLYPILRAGTSPAAEAVRSQAIDLGLDLGEPTSPATTKTAPAPTARVEKPFFGREAEMATIGKAIGEERVAAIFGLAGVGKSELARQVAATAAGTPSQVLWVDVSTISSPELLPELLSQQIQPGDVPASDVASLATMIGQRRLLLVLDGIDSMATEVAPLLALVDRCQQLQLLLTSRVGFNLPVGVAVRLDGLPLRTTGPGPGPAVQLFSACFERQAPVGSELAPDDPAAAEICRKLDGHPLAIQLAAGWLNVLTPQEIADGLSAGSAAGPPLLDHGGEAGDQAGFPEMMSSTWELLDPRCRAALARLSVLPGGYDRQTAETVAGCDLVTFRRLASWSLVSRRDARWYSCHPLVQAYAGRRLAEDPALATSARQAHADLVLSAVAGAPTVDAFDTGIVLAGVEDPVANVLTVFADLVERRRLGAVADLVDPLDRLLGFHGRHLTLLQALEAAVEAVADGPDGEATVARLEMHLVWLRLRLGRYRQAATTADRLLTEDGIADDLVVELTRARSAIDRTEGDVDRGLQRLVAVRDRAATVSERHRAMVEDDIGLCQMVLGLYPESRESYREVLAWARRTGSQPVIARTLLSLGIGHHDAGEILDSLAYLVEAKSVVTVNGLRHIEPFVDVKLARTYLVDGDMEAAARVIEGARARSEAGWEPWLAAEFDLVSARLAAAGNDPATMWAMLERSLKTSADLDDVPFVAKSYVAMVDLGASRPEVGPAAAGGVALLAAVVAAGSGADHADRLEAGLLLDQLGVLEDDVEAKPILDLIDDGYGYLRRGRLLTSRSGGHQDHRR